MARLHMCGATGEPRCLAQHKRDAHVPRKECAVPHSRTSVSVTTWRTMSAKIETSLRALFRSMRDGC